MQSITPAGGAVCPAPIPCPSACATVAICHATHPLAQRHQVCIPCRQVWPQRHRGPTPPHHAVAECGAQAHQLARLLHAALLHKLKRAAPPPLRGLDLQWRGRVRGHVRGHARSLRGHLRGHLSDHLGGAMFGVGRGQSAEQASRVALLHSQSHSPLGG